MIVAHSCDAFLADRWRAGDAWSAVDILFGFVAPAFLLLSGAGIGLSLARRAQDAATDPRTTDRQRGLVRRLMLTLALGYWLQIPVLSLRQLVWNHRPAEIARLFDANILQVIAITGLVIVAVARTGIAPAAQRAIAVALALAAMATAPYAWHAGWAADVCIPLRALVAGQPAATFPLLPFAAYSLVGFALAPLLAPSHPATDRRRLAAMLAAGGVLLLGGLALDIPMRALRYHDDFWHGSIQHSLFRLGGVLVGLAIAMLPGARVTARPTLLERVGRRSLAIYALHLMLVYGSPMTMGARYWLSGALDRSLAPWQVALIAIAVAVITCAAALWWPVLRRRAAGLARVLWWGWWAAFAALFLLTP